MTPDTSEGNSLRWPDFQSDYRFTMSGAHRKPAYEIGAPSISWHTGFWLAETPKDAKKSNPTKTWLSFGRRGTKNETEVAAKTDPKKTVGDQYDLWIDAIEELICNIYHQLEEASTAHGWAPPRLTNLQPTIQGERSETESIRLLRREYLKCPAANGAPSAAVERVGVTPYIKGRFLNEDIPKPATGDTPFTKAKHDAKAKRKPPQTWYETVHIDSTWQSMPLGIRIEVNDEYFTITSTIDFSRMKELPENNGKCAYFYGDPSKSAVPGARAALYQVIETTNERRKHADEAMFSAMGKRKDSELLESASKFLYFKLWDQLKVEIFEASPGNGYIGQLGNCFVDLRNVSLQCSHKDPKKVVNPWKKVVDALNEKDEGTLVLDPSTWTDDTLRHTVRGHVFKKDDMEWVNAIHPILLAVEKSEVNDLAADPVEYTFTKFFRGRCIYGSGFGPQVEDLRVREVAEREKTGDPLTYILLFGYDERRQMGRLLYLLHTLATFRHAALHGLRNIKYDYDRHLDKVEKTICEIEELVSRAFGKTYSEEGLDFRVLRLVNARAAKGESSRKHSFDKKAAKKLGALLEAVHYDLGEIDDLKSGDGTGKAPGLVPLRAWRSNYYRDRFERLAPALNTKTIEGFQRYDRFVEHRLGRAYYTIRMVADRFAQLREKETRLRSEWMSIKADIRQGEIEEIQSVGEFFFFAVLCPYYASHLILSASESDNEWMQSIGRVLKIWVPQANTDGSNYDHLLVVAGCCTITLCLWGVNKLLAKVPSKVGLAIKMLVAGLVILSVWQFGHALADYRAAARSHVEGVSIQRRF